MHSLPVRISRALETRGPMTLADIREAVGHPDPKSSIAWLKEKECIAFDHALNRYILLSPYRVRRQMRHQVVSPSAREAVYAACHGLFIGDIAQLTGLSKDIVGPALNQLSHRKCICYRPGEGWFQTDPHATPEPCAVSRMKEGFVTQDDLAWQRHWHPSNRAARRAGHIGVNA